VEIGENHWVGGEAAPEDALLEETCGETLSHPDKERKKSLESTETPRGSGGGHWLSIPKRPPRGGFKKGKLKKKGRIFQNSQER